ncbi:MAG: LLM class flavin-dependent oxidoreductase, partial [Candidatus Binataceae bacterium]
FGIFDHVEQTTSTGQLHQLFNERMRLLEAADEAGFWGYHVAEHHFTPLSMAPSQNVYLAAAAARTKRIRLGPLVYLLPFYHPLRLIEEIAMLDNLSGGRLEIGVGRGVSPFELALWGIPFLEAQERYDEALEVIVNGLRNDRLTHRGRYYQFDNVPMELRPMQRPNPGFWYGCMSERSTTYAARHGMNMVLIGPAARAGELVRLYREIRAKGIETRDNLNPHLSAPKISIQRHIYVAASEREAEEVGRAAYNALYDNLEKLWRDFHVLVQDFSPDYDVVRKAGGNIIGTVSSVRDQLADVIEQVGCDYVVLPFAWGNLSAEQTRRSFDLFVEKVMPDFVLRDKAA